jgi:hypothetical protein
MTAALQPELAIKLPAPEVSPEAVEQLVAILKEKPLEWFTAERLAHAAGYCDVVDDQQIVTEKHLRKVRKIASAAAPKILSWPGSPGYRLATANTVPEIAHAIEALESQGKDMIRRANVYRVSYHKFLRDCPPAEPAQPALL